MDYLCLDEEESSNNSTLSRARNSDVLDINDMIYEKIKFLGKGTFGSVFLYRKSNRNECQYVVLKRIHVDSLDKKQIDSVINEINILSIINHPNIIKYHNGSFILKKKFYIEMEYADAGTMASFLDSLNVPLKEFEILALFVQIVSAVVYLHQKNIIHRDIKTKNIFLTKRGLIKLGDFGISKILISNNDALTFAGTPFYICPEIAEGRSYNKPCDIWSLGCVLYEMATLTKIFDDTVIAVLIKKIIKGKFSPLNSQYSKQFQKLVYSSLRKNPKKRPTAEQMLDKVTLMINRNDIRNNFSVFNDTTIALMKENEESDHCHFHKKRNTLTRRYSYLFQMDLTHPNIDFKMIEFPRKIRIKQLCKGDTHFLALSYDNLVFSWGRGAEGELGQGKEKEIIDKPELISFLNNYSINKICCGKQFSVFIDKNGLILTCGSNHTGCKEKTIRFRPSIVHSLLEMNIVDVSCSQDHIVAISSDGSAFAWGCNSFGKLGINELTPKIDEPRKVVMADGIKIKRVICGSNATAFIDYSNQAWLCGNNEYNKLALDQRQGCGYRRIPYSMRPTKCQINKKIQQVSLGKEHSFFILKDSTIIASGCNDNAQLGLYHCKNIKKPTEVILMKNGQKIQVKLKYEVCRLKLFSKFIKAGSCFSMFVSDNGLYFMGTRNINQHKKSKQMASSKEELINEDFIIGECHETVMEIIAKFGPDYSIIKLSQPKIVIKKLRDLKMVSNTQSRIIMAQNILKLYTTRAILKKEITINDFYCFEDDDVFIVIDSLTHENAHPEETDIQVITQQQADIKTIQNDKNENFIQSKLDELTEHVIILYFAV